MSAPVDEDAALVRPLEPGEEPQQRGLAAARRPQQREELAAPDVERHVVDRRRPCANRLARACSMLERRLAAVIHPS